MNATDITTTDTVLDWDGGAGYWSATGADGTTYEVTDNGGRWVLEVNGTRHYGYHFLTDAMTEAESLAQGAAEAPGPITRDQLDWLCVTQRAAENDADSVTLWASAATVMRKLIAAFNVAARDEVHAAHAQFLIGRLAAFAVMPVDGPTMSGVPVPLVAERMKDQLMHIARGGYDSRARL